MIYHKMNGGVLAEIEFPQKSPRLRRHGIICPKVVILYHAERGSAGYINPGGHAYPRAKPDGIGIWDGDRVAAGVRPVHARWRNINQLPIGIDHTASYGHRHRHKSA